MDRRTFLTTTAAALLPATSGSAAPDPRPPMRGVNLGAWLVLEKWMTPSLFAGLQANDEYSFCAELGPQAAAERLKRHRETWITDDDFKWIAARGLNAVRLPVGYWVAEENPPFVSGAETLERALGSAKKAGLGVLLDLHGAPGSQNAWDHSGRAGTLGWHTDPKNVEHTLQVIEALAARLKRHDNLIGIELLNEPRWDVPLDTLKRYYEEGCARVRKHLGPEQAAVVIHDGFRPFDWGGFMQPPAFRNVLLDTHLYQCYTEEDRKRNVAQQVAFAAEDRRRHLEKMSAQLPCLVGEWSCALDPHSTAGLEGKALDAGLRAFGDAQLASYGATTRGWFFWTYKTESGGGWSFRDCVEKGWLPEAL